MTFRPRCGRRHIGFSASGWHKTASLAVAARLDHLKGMQPSRPTSAQRRSNRGSVRKGSSTGVTFRPELRRGREMPRQLSLDRASDVRLHPQVVAPGHIERFRPDVRTIGSADQLHRDSHTALVFADAPLDDGIDPELPRHFSDVDPRSSKCKARRAGYDPQTLDTSQPADQFLSEAIAKSIVLNAACKVGEGEHGQRLHGVALSRRWRLTPALAEPSP